MKRYKFNVEITLDTDENVNNNLTNEELNNSFIEGLTELLNDELGDCCKINVNEDSKWQKLKKWLKNQITDLRHIDIKTETQSLRVNYAVNCFRQVLNQIRELEGEDDR